MSRIYTIRERWWQRRRPLLCCNPPCLNYADSRYIIHRDGLNWSYCSPACLVTAHTEIMP